MVVDEAAPLAPGVGRQLQARGAHLPLERPAQEPILMALTTFMALMALMALMTLMTLMVLVGFASFTTAS